MNAETTARQFELTMQSALLVGLAMQNIYRSSESLERLLPCVVLAAKAKGEDFSLRFSGRYATTLEFRATAMVAISSQDSAKALELFAQRLKSAIEGAVIPGGWNYLKLDYEGDDRAFDATKREFTHVYTVTAHPI